MEVRIDHISEQEDGRFTIILTPQKGQPQRALTNCDFSCWGEAKMMDDEYVTIRFERVVPIADMDKVRKEYVD